MSFLQDSTSPANLMAAQSDLVSDFGRFSVDNLFVNHTVLNTRNLHRARASVGGVFFDHDLRTPGDRDLVDFLHRSVRLSSLSFNLISYGAEVEVSTRQINRSHYVVVLPLSGQAEVCNHEQSTGLEKGEFIVLDPMNRFRFEMLPDHSHLAIGIPRARFLSHLNAPESRFAGQPVQFRRRPYRISDVGRSFTDFLAYICREVDSPGTLATRPAVAEAMEESLLSLLTASLLDPGNAARDGVDGPVPWYVIRADRFMKENLTEEISAADIACAAGAPVRTLYHAFRKCRGVSPMVWLRSLRLARARLDLLNGEPGSVNVTDVAHRYQMSHMGRFARAYFQEFGEYPSRTMRTAHQRSDDA